ncbi:hypothetical protein K7X08_021860 [Anisodus acutangulus]|uniref:RNase H type-1 domain-containing protein n=1 Tax=Anisodus acutangulus TaxID=402998 RepID=A0A9Q1L748_9SOLA|nr:hypothetical protein K7X08_021860 [Anisodus acutangulus]
MYKKLYLVSFANLKLQEMWCNSRRESSGAQMSNCPRENMTDMLEDILLSFLSTVQLKLVFDDPHREGIFGIVFPRSDPCDKAPSWFTYSVTCKKAMYLNLNKHWYTDNFLGFAIYCQLPFLNDELPKHQSYLFRIFWGVAVSINLERASMDQQPLEKIVHLQVSNVVACGSFDCFIFFQVDTSKVHHKGKGKDTTLLNDPNDYCRFEVSIDSDIPLNLGVRLVYADDIEDMRAMRELYKPRSRTTVDLNIFDVDSRGQCVLEIEVKGAWKEGHEWAGMAWIAYMKSGIIVAAARISLKVTSKLHAEVHAFEYAVKWATLGCRKILILSDSPTFIKELHNSDCCSDQDLVYVLHECLEFMEERGISWEVVKVSSFAVSEAKEAVKKAMKTYRTLAKHKLLL